MCNIENREFLSSMFLWKDNVSDEKHYKTNSLKIQCIEYCYQHNTINNNTDYNKHANKDGTDT